MFHDGTSASSSFGCGVIVAASSAFFLAVMERFGLCCRVHALGWMLPRCWVLMFLAWLEVPRWNFHRRCVRVWRAYLGGLFHLVAPCCFRPQ
jgi:hypothetical protein